MVKLQLALLGLYASAVYGDVYMQNPRGSNNRNCRTDNDENRRNANRVFDSQNNDKGGYSCPRTWPFDCYKVVDDGNAFNQCQNQNAGQGKNALDATGQLVNTNAVNTPTMYYYAGSELSVEWTAQHGMGTNSELHSDVIVQYACEDTLNDNCAAAAVGQNPITANPAQKVCTLRDGTPIRVADGNNGLNAEATDTIPDNANAQDDMRYGRHESFAYYQECKRRERNKGLYAADQNLNGNDARTTRQNPNANRNGLECPEESEYYPYFHSSPWKDIAIVTSDMTACQAKAAQSQNVVPKGRCQCPAGQCTGDGTQPNNEAACKAKGYTWVMDAAHGLPAPKCVMGQYSRQNHLGNIGAGPNTQAYNMTIPEPLAGKTQRCALRIRYNMSSTDFGDASVVATAAQNKQNSPLKDNDESEALTYIPTTGLGGAKAKLSITTNTDQYARTFQDRSYVFEIRPRPAGGRLLQNGGACAKVYNLNVRGKRGNIVQTYPAVEYDFTPDHLVVETNECVHVQWTGSDYNPNRNGNNGEGGPYASNNQNKETKADRSNIVQMSNPGNNMPILNSASFNMFQADAATYKRLAFLDQPIDNANSCLDFAALKAKFNNRANREETHLNCMKLSGAKTPYFDAGVQTPGTPGEYKYISTRNNNFSNRGQKGTLVVKNKVVSTPAPTFGVTAPPPPGVAPTLPPTDPPTSATITQPGAPDGAKDQDASAPTSDIMSSKNLPLLIGVGSALVAAVGFFAYSRTSGGRAPAVNPGGDYQQQQPGFGKRVSTMFQGFQGQWGGQQQQQQYPPQGYYNR